MQGADEHARDLRRLSGTMFLAQQFAVNLLVAVVLTIAATTLVFHGRTAVPLWGIGNLAVDLIPSTLLPTIGATIAMTKAAVSALRRGLIKPASTTIYDILPKRDALAGLVIGIGLLVVLGSGFIGVVTFVYDRQPIPYADIVICKLIYALFLCVANTPMIIRRARERRRFDHDNSRGV